ncbi:MAG: MlaD family protein [Chthoniobacterales bacterium]|nr:MlaD family protein [Chthoniobacterales bacterium]
MTLEYERSLQIRAGIFTFLGLCLIAGLVTYFGRFGEGTRRYYQINVEYPNASGLLNGAEVLMAGAKIGKVARGPQIRPDGKGVSVLLKIYENIQIPSNAQFSIGSSGLLGDKFVEITLPEHDPPASPLKPGQTIKGLSHAGMAELTSQGAKLVEEIRSTVQNIDSFVKKLDRDLLAESNTSAIRATLQKLEQIATTLNSTAVKLDAAVEQTQPQLKETLQSATEALNSGKQALEEGAKAARELQAFSNKAKELLSSLQKPEGPIGVLLHDAKAGQNLRVFLQNLRERGILFYRDRKE